MLQYETLLNHCRMSLDAALFRHALSGGCPACFLLLEWMPGGRTAVADGRAEASAVPKAGAFILALHANPVRKKHMTTDDNDCRFPSGPD